jgi:hypothetical protein
MTDQYSDPTKWRPSREFGTDSTTADGLVSLGLPRNVESVIRLYALDPKTNSFWDRFYLNDHYRLTVLRPIAVLFSRKSEIYTNKAHTLCVIENDPFMATLFRQDGGRVIEKLLLTLPTWKHLNELREGNSHAQIIRPNQLTDPTSPSVTPPAGAGGAPSVAADH